MARLVPGWIDRPARRPGRAPRIARVDPRQYHAAFRHGAGLAGCHAPGTVAGVRHGSWPGLQGDLAAVPFPAGARRRSRALRLAAAAGGALRPRRTRWRIPRHGPRTAADE